MKTQYIYFEDSWNIEPEKENETKPELNNNKQH